MKTIHALKVTAMLPLAFMVLVLLIFGIGETVGGDISGIQHFVPVILVGLIAWLGWKRPLVGGILFLIGALVEVEVFSLLLEGREASAIIAPLVIMVLPPALSGGLFLLAHWLEATNIAAK